jgi:hypothetical protein
MPRQFKLGGGIPPISDDSEVMVGITTAAKVRSALEFHEEKSKTKLVWIQFRLA